MMEMWTFSSETRFRRDWTMAEARWVRLMDRWVPYPFQNNVRYLPPEITFECLSGLIKAQTGQGKIASPADAKNFGEFIDAVFGEGIARVFMRPYNFKVWAHEPEMMNKEWIGERVATLDIDAETSARALTYPTVSHLEKLAPFGQGNRRPLFAMRNCTLVGAARRMGARGQTLGMTIAQDGATIRCVGFRMGDLADALAGVRNVSIAGRPALNTYRGKTNVQLEIVDVQWD